MSSLAAVSPDHILKNLGELWIALGQQQESGVLRACAMTMIVVDEESVEPAPVQEMIAELMHGHPSRAILLRVRPGEETDLESRVYAQCWMPFGRRQQICCEQIEVRASEARLVEAHRLLLGLLAPDLPVVLICRSLRLLLLPAFEPMLAVADRIIIDSAASTEARHLLETIASQRRAGRQVVDLAWTRLTPWRETIAAEFDDPQVLQKFSRLKRITIAHRRQGPPVEAWYLAAWLRCALEQPVEIQLQAGASKEAIELLLLSAEQAQLAMTRSPGAALHIVWNEQAKTVPFPPATDADLLREELSLSGRDKIYDEVLDEAITLSKR